MLIAGAQITSVRRHQPIELLREISTGQALQSVHISCSNILIVGTAFTKHSKQQYLDLFSRLWGLLSFYFKS